MTTETTSTAKNPVSPEHAIGLPSPRLEFRWTNESGDAVNWVCAYSIVIPLAEHDIRRGEDDERTEIILQIASTKVTMGRPRLPLIEGCVETPFRDGCHAKWDKAALGGTLPVVAICGDIVSTIDR